MTKEMIDNYLDNGVVDAFKNKVDLQLYYKLCEHKLLENAVYMLYSVLDPDFKKYFCYKMITNDLEYYDILFDNDVKEEIYNELANSGELALFEKLNGLKVRKIIRLTEESKQKAFNDMNEKEIAIGLSSLNNDQQKIDNLKYIKYQGNVFFVLASIKNDKYKYNYIKSLNLNSKNPLGENFYLLLSSIKDKELKYDLLKTMISKNVGELDRYFATLLEFQTDDFMKELIEKLDIKGFEKLRDEKYFTKDALITNIDKILPNYFNNESDIKFAREKFSILVNKNSIYASKIDFNLLNETMFRTFDERYLNEIFLYPDIQKKLSSINDIELLNLVNNMLVKYVEENGESRWDMFFEDIIDKLTSSEYERLISDYVANNSIDIDLLFNVLKQSNDFCINSLNELIHYSTTKKELCDAIINGKQIPEKYEFILSLDELEKNKYAVLQKIYGINITDAKRLVSSFGADLDNIVPEQEKNKETLEQIKFISNILNEKDINKLKSIYMQNNNDFSQNLDVIETEKNYQALYLGQYNRVLFDPTKDGIILNTDGDIKLIDAGVDFNILMTSVSAYNQKQIENYKDGWNNSYDFCGSFIRNDMLGTASIPNVCFGFSSMDEKSLLMSSSSNMSSKARYFNTKPGIKVIKYYTPNTQINMRGQDFANGIETSYSYNEMVFKKELEGTIKQPDYILVFRENGNISNMDKAVKSSHDFGNIPIVIVDKDKCAISELQKLGELVNQYNITGDKNILENITIKVHNNSVSNNYFVGNVSNVLQNLNIQRDQLGDDFLNEYLNAVR